MMAEATCPFCHTLSHLRELPDEDLVWQFAHSVALLGTWQSYQGYCLLVAKRHATELSQLAEAERAAHLQEMCLLARAIEATFRPHKLNYELLGNQAPHVHWHLFPRSAQDPERLRPVWFALDRAERDADENRRLRAGALSRAEITAALRRTLHALRIGSS